MPFYSYHCRTYKNWLTLPKWHALSSADSRVQPCNPDIGQLTNIGSSPPPLPHRAGAQTAQKQQAGLSHPEAEHPRPVSVVMRAHIVTVCDAVRREDSVG